MSFTLVDFVRESNKIEGVLREPTEQEVRAVAEFITLPHIAINNLSDLVDIFAPGNTLRDQVGLNVRVGRYIAPPGGPAITSALSDLLVHESDPWRLHVQYEAIHPFTDGNGRSGRALWLWAMRGNAPLGFLHHFYYQTLAAIGRVDAAPP